MIALPIDPFLAEIVQRLEKYPNLLLKAQPGTGKTTRVPPALLKSSLSTNRPEIWVLEPRRLAAKLAARRVASELGENVGETVGYQFRFEKVGGPQTRIRFLTEGMILRHLLSQPNLPQVAAVILDEFHERHLQGDIALAALRKLQQTRRPDLRLVVMSATLQTDQLEAYLAAPQKLEIGAPHHPLALRYFTPPSEMRLEQAVVRGVKMAFDDPEYRGGDFLVFLPGMAEIRRAEEALGTLVRERGCVVFALHGELSKEEQDLAINRHPKTKILLSTNIAESSLTIEGVSVVLDSGLHRSASYSSWSGMPSLQTRPISKASAIQRAGRASRTGPGLCFRLYAQGDFDHRSAQDTPEILRADLAQTLLELKAMGNTDEMAFPWFERPPETALQNARTLLFRLGALESARPASPLTEIGNRLSKLPTHPRLARLLLEGESRGCLDSAIHLAALLSEGAMQGMDALESVKRQPAPERVKKQLAGMFRGTDRRTSDPSALAQAALAAFPDRVAKLRLGSREDLVLSGGGSVKTADLGSLGKASYFLVLDARETKGFGQARAQVRATSLIALEPEWLLDLEPSPLTEEKSALAWDSQRKRVTAKSRLLYDQLVLEESEAAISDFEQAAEFLVHSVLGIRKEQADALTVHEWIERLLPVCSREVLENVFARQKLAQEYLGQEKVLSVYSQLLKALHGKTSAEELKDLDWENALLPPEKFSRSLPTHVDLPGGRKVKVNYSIGRAPWIESRLQDFFGMKQGPVLLDGKLPLTLHLLAPNYRAVQVTTDLAGFWKNTYPTVKKELSRNYPRHSWPEDPLTAKPPAPKGRR